MVVSSSFDPDEITCAEYSDEILAIGTSSGSVYLHDLEVMLFQCRGLHEMDV